jgi:hypothetical protein
LGSTLANLFCRWIARIAQIVTIRRSCPVWLLNSFYVTRKASRFRAAKSVRKITFCRKNFAYLADGLGARAPSRNQGNIAMTAKAHPSPSMVTPRRLAAAIGLAVTLASVTSASAIGTPELHARRLSPLRR